MLSDPLPDTPTNSEILETLRRIESLLAEQSAAALGRDAAARFIGVSVATLDRLASVNPALRPVRVSQGRVVWLRSALEAYLKSL